MCIELSLRGLFAKTPQKGMLFEYSRRKGLRSAVFKRRVQVCEVRVRFCLPVPVLVRHSVLLILAPTGLPHFLYLFQEFMTWQPAS